jgi:hypothetical protein
VKENIYKRTAINQPLTGGTGEGQEDVRNSAYRVWTESANVEDRTCKEK